MLGLPRWSKRSRDRVQWTLRMMGVMMDDQEQNRGPMASQGDGSRELSPNDHLKMMLELCQPESMGMVRRWVAALMLAPEGERESIVQAVEKQIVDEFAD